MTTGELGPIRTDTSDLSPDDIIEITPNPLELAESLSEAEIRDRIAVWDEEAEIQRDIIRTAEAKRDLALHKMHIAQEALSIARDKGLE